jgi:ferredoxin
MKSITSVEVDPGLCTCHKLCLSEAPNVLTYDSVVDRAVVKENARAFFAQQAEDIYSAAAVCPMDAIRINGEGPPRRSGMTVKKIRWWSRRA